MKEYEKEGGVSEQMFMITTLFYMLFSDCHISHIVISSNAR